VPVDKVDKLEERDIPSAALAQTGLPVEKLCSESVWPQDGDLGSLNAPMGVAVDLNGSIWTVNSGDNTVSQFIGLGSPTVIPLSALAGP